MSKKVLDFVCLHCESNLFLPAVCLSARHSLTATTLNHILAFNKSSHAMYICLKGWQRAEEGISEGILSSYVFPVKWQQKNLIQKPLTVHVLWMLIQEIFIINVIFHTLVSGKFYLCSLPFLLKACQMFLCSVNICVPVLRAELKPEIAAITNSMVENAFNIHHLIFNGDKAKFKILVSRQL